MRYLTFAVVALGAALGVVITGTVRAADPFYAGTFYLGTWTFVTARSAPWGFPARLPDSADRRDGMVWAGSDATLMPAAEYAACAR